MKDNRDVPPKEAKGKRLRSRWLADYTLKDEEWIVGSRVVAQELATDVRSDTFASTFFGSNETRLGASMLNAKSFHGVRGAFFLREDEEEAIPHGPASR